AQATPGAIKSGAKTAGSAIWNTGAAAYAAAKDPDTWKSGLDAVKQTIASGYNALPSTDALKKAGMALPRAVGQGLGTASGYTTDLAVQGLGAALRGAGVVLSGRTNAKQVMTSWVTKLGEWSGAV